jgi:hypothetical protein
MAGWLIVACLILGGVMVANSLYKQRTQREALLALRDKRRDILAGEVEELGETMVLEPSFSGVDGFSAIAHAWADSKLVIIEGAWYDEKNQELQEPVVITRTIGYQDIIACEIWQDSFVRTNKTGGKPKNFVRAVELKVNIADTNDPVHIITFLLKEAESGSFEHDEAHRLAQQWEGIIKAVIHKAAHEPDVAHKLTELDLLFRQGVLTEPEYKAQKAKLLAKQFLSEGRVADWSGLKDPGKLREVGQA